jgi:hypothetical protein
MMHIRILSLAGALAFSAAAFGQTCPKVAYTTPTATMKSLVTSVNCLVGTADKVKAAAHVEVSKTGLLVDSFQVIGPQHSRIYRKVVLALLSVPAGSEIKTALVTPDSPEGSVAGTAGAECKVKINADNTVDGQCNLTGGTLYVVYHN